MNVSLSPNSQPTQTSQPKTMPTMLFVTLFAPTPVQSIQHINHSASGGTLSLSLKCSTQYSSILILLFFKALPDGDKFHYPKEKLQL